MNESIPWYKSEAFRNVLAFVVGALLALFTAQTGIEPKQPPEWLLPIITEVKETNAVVKKIEENNLIVLNQLKK